MIAMGYDIKVVKDLLGHQDIRITEIYAKAGDRVLQNAIKSFELFQKSGYDLVTRRELPLLNDENLPKTSARDRVQA